jgi:hypothetical protein
MGDYSKSLHDCNTRLAVPPGAMIPPLWRTSVRGDCEADLLAPIRSFDERGGFKDLTPYDLLPDLQP